MIHPVGYKFVKIKIKLFGSLRFRASKILNKKEIQAKIVEATDTEADIIGLTENYHRRDLTTEEKEKNQKILRGLMLTNYKNVIIIVLTNKINTQYMLIRMLK